MRPINTRNARLMMSRIIKRWPLFLESQMKTQSHKTRTSHIRKMINKHTRLFIHNQYFLLVNQSVTKENRSARISTHDARPLTLTPVLKSQKTRYIPHAIQTCEDADTTVRHFTAWVAFQHYLLHHHVVVYFHPTQEFYLEEQIVLRWGLNWMDSPEHCFDAHLSDYCGPRDCSLRL
jgi:hypothetical protein